MKDFWVTVLPTVIGSIIGTGGLVSLFMARKERKAAQNLTAGNALDIMQKVYAQFVKDTEFEIGQMKEEIRMLRKVVEKYKETCDNCPNKKN